MALERRIGGEDHNVYELRPEDETSPWPHRVADLGRFMVPDATAVRDLEGRAINVAVVNRDLHRDVEAAIEIADSSGLAAAVAYELNARDVDIYNSFESPDYVWVLERPLTYVGPTITYSFPAHSLTVLRLQPRAVPG